MDFTDRDIALLKRDLDYDASLENFEENMVESSNVLEAVEGPFKQGRWSF